MKLIYSVVAAQVAVVAYSKFAVSTPSAKINGKRVAPRKLQNEQMMCGTSGDSGIKKIEGYCSNTIQTFDTEEWQPCCAFTPDDKGACRYFETEGEYCNPETDENGCAQLGSDDTIAFNIEFVDAAEDVECCQTCTCFGDPECVSFDGTPDLWIPCDARPTEGGSCNMQRDICEGMTDTNGNACVWTVPYSSSATDKVNIARDGSPCVPSNAEALTMNMFSMPGYAVELALAERGVIDQITITTAAGEASITRKGCFIEAEGWVNDAELSIAEVERTDKVVMYTARDPATGVSMTMFCVRAIIDEDGTQVNGNPRINIQELLVPDSDNENQREGFCQTGVIAENNNGLKQDQTLTHARCSQDKPNALQACKHLVAWGSSVEQLQLCGQAYCTVANLGDEVDACISAISEDVGEGWDTLSSSEKGDVNEAWITYYCKAVVNNKAGTDTPVSQQACETLVGEGYQQAILEMGKGLISELPEQPEDCGTSLSDYVLDGNSPKPCEDGVYIDLLDQESGEFLETFFIPARKPLCNNVVVANAEEFPELFTTSFRMRQCDFKAECPAISSCEPSHGVNFGVQISSQTARIDKLFKEGLLQCIPNPEFPGSTDWCFDGSYEQTELCPCPDDQRRVLMGEIGA